MGLYIFAACFATSSATFANPAVTVARAFTNSFTGIAPGSLLVYIAGQLIGATCGVAVTVLLYPRQRIRIHRTRRDCRRRRMPDPYA